ncbi:MAG: hypothetical protein ACXWG0_02375 [Chthoniobacterales bacterium]
MSDEVVIIAPELTPGAGGVADYTLRLVEELGDRIAPRFVLPNDIKQGLRANLPPAHGKVLLQYSAYAFDHVGYPRRLLRDLTGWKKTSGGLLVIMFHEIWAFWPLLNKNRFVQRLHRADIGRLLAHADAVFTSTPSQTEHLIKLAPRCSVQSLPVGSNIRRTARIDGPREAGVAVLFGLQSARLRTLRKMGSHLTGLAAIRKIISVGAGNSDAGTAEERALLSALSLTNSFELRQAAPETEVSKLLATAAFALSVQDELSITKSGTFMACAAHGLNIVSPLADPLGVEPICWLTSPAELSDGIAGQELQMRAENLRQWQQRTASWPMIAERFADALHLEKAVGA